MRPAHSAYQGCLLHLQQMRNNSVKVKLVNTKEKIKQDPGGHNMHEGDWQVAVTCIKQNRRDRCHTITIFRTREKNKLCTHPSSSTTGWPLELAVHPSTKTQVHPNKFPVDPLLYLMPLLHVGWFITCNKQNR